MATALTRSRGRDGARLSAMFEREVAPELPALEGARRRYRLIYIAAVAAMLGAVFLAVLWIRDPSGAFYVVGLAVLLGLLAMQGAQRAYGVRVRRAAMPAICSTIGDIEHSIGDAAEIDLDDLARVGLVPSHRRQRVDDVFRGRYRATGFTLAEVRLRRTGTRQRRNHTVFRGLVMAIEVPRPVRARILIAKDAGRIVNSLKGWFKSFGEMQRVPLADQAFEERFELYADQPDRARATMTPELCANLVALSQSHDGMQAAFTGDRFFVTIPKRGDLFRIGSLFRPADTLEQDAAGVMEEVRIVHRLIDHLHGDRPQPRQAQERQEDQGPGPVIRC